MKERGFMPMSTAGVLVVLLFLAVVGHAASLQHQQSMSTAGDISASEVRILYGETETNVEALLRDSVYRGLWEVSKRADQYPNADSRKQAVEALASEYFTERLNEFFANYPTHDARVELCQSDNCVNVALQRAENGYVLATTELPNTVARLCSRDGKLSVKVPLDETQTFVDSRYFLLQERMDDFLQERGNIGTLWKGMEYAWAWGEAWLRGDVNLSEGRTKGFFQIAWAMHELNSFGSSDYLAAAQSLAGMENPATEEPLVVTPIHTADVERLEGFIDRAVGAIDGAKALLGTVDDDISLAKNIAATENLENGGLGKIKAVLDNSAAKITGANGKISDAGGEFQGLLNSLSQGASGNVMIAAIYQGLTTRKLDPSYPSLKEQVEWGVEGATEKISALKDAVTRASGNMDAATARSALDQLSTQVESSMVPLLHEPEAKRLVYVKAYAYDPPREVLRELQVYIDCKADGGIGSLRKVLNGARGGFEEMNEFSQQGEDSPSPPEIDEGLKNALLQNPLPAGLNRENIYELLPPPPINPSPGLSVYHNFTVESVGYAREDPAGWLYPNFPTATPIPIPFIGITLWWGQWNTEVKLEHRAVEEAFDFDNPTLPLAKGVGYVHSPLAYKWNVPDETFGARVIVVSLNMFTISTS